MAGPYQTKPSEAGKTKLEDATLKLTVEKLKTRFPGLNDDQLKELAGTSAAARNRFEGMVRGYGIKDEKVIDQLESAYFHKTSTSQQTLETYLNASQLANLTTAIENEWTKNQARFTQLIKQSPDLASATAAICRKIYGECGWIYAIEENKTEVRGTALAGDLAKEKIALAKLDKTITDAEAEHAIADGSQARKDALNWIAQSLNQEQRNTLFNLALQVGFASSIVNTVRSYFTNAFTNPADRQAAQIVASQARDSAMSEFEKRMEAINALVDKILKDKQKEDGKDPSEKNLSPEERSKKRLEEAKELEKKFQAEEPAGSAELAYTKKRLYTVAETDAASRAKLENLTSLEKAFSDPKFEEIFDKNKAVAIAELGHAKYFTGKVPEKVQEAIINPHPPEVAQHGPRTDLGYLIAYGKTLDEYRQLLQSKGKEK